MAKVKLAFASMVFAWTLSAVALAETVTRESSTDAQPHLLPAALIDDDFVDLGPLAEARVELGWALFFDKILSGNRNISCATCHHPLAHSTDGLSLPLGEGARGLGVARQPGDTSSGARNRVPRNSPGLFNLGAREVRALFHDGRVETDAAHPAGFRSPAGDQLPVGLSSVLAVQAMFPVTSADEMAGHPGENEIAGAGAAGRLAGPDGVWDLLADRLRAVPRYVALFRRAFDDVSDADSITFAHAANAIATFEASAFRADNTPFDRWLRGDALALDGAARRGLDLFYGKAGCARCHSGPLLTDHRFHAIGMPQIGPGQGNGPSEREDFGRELATGDANDRYRFRTPPLRNVALTGPWGHDGAYVSLSEAIRHHLDPAAALERYDRHQGRLPGRRDLTAADLDAHDDAAARAAIAAANELEPVTLTELEIADLTAFLEALTDPSSIDMSELVPTSVPSGLPLYD